MSEERSPLDQIDAAIDHMIERPYLYARPAGVMQLLLAQILWARSVVAGDKRVDVRDAMFQAGRIHGIELDARGPLSAIRDRLQLSEDELLHSATAQAFMKTWVELVRNPQGEQP